MGLTGYPVTNLLREQTPSDPQYSPIVEKTERRASERALCSEAQQVRGLIREEAAALFVPPDKQGPSLRHSWSRRGRCQAANRLKGG